MKNHRIKFIDSHLPELLLPEGSVLCEHLTAMNSPLLFGCRSGICGTCLCEIQALTGDMLAPTLDEQEALGLYAPSNPKARLACQIQLTTDIAIKKIESYE